MTAMDLLLFARGPAFAAATGLLIAGIFLRLAEIFALGRAADLSSGRPGVFLPGTRQILTKSIPRPGFLPRTWITYVLGYSFHIGFFVVLLFLAPHIAIVQAHLGFAWPALPTPLVDAAAVATLVMLVLIMVYRLLHPVKRFLTTAGDWLAWLLAFLPVLTGYLATHHIGPYTTMLAVHILCVEALMALLPFTKLAHAFTFAISRWYGGSIHAHKGVTL